MVEALWTVEFFDPTSNGLPLGTGIAVLETNRVFGGDAQYFYVGDYEVSGPDIKATVKIVHYSGPPHSVFGQLGRFTLSLIGKIAQDEKSISMIGNIVRKPEPKIVLKFKRQAELP